MLDIKSEKTPEKKALLIVWRASFLTSLLTFFTARFINLPPFIQSTPPIVPAALTNPETTESIIISPALSSPSIAPFIAVSAKPAAALMKGAPLVPKQ